MNASHLGLSMLVLFWATAAANAQVPLGLTYSLPSAVLKEERHYRVHLPASYPWAKDRRYSVLYVLDGQTQFLHTAASADYLAAQGEIPELIVVGIDSTVRVRDYSPTDWPEAWVGGGGAGNFKQFLSRELLPAVEKAYRTDGFRVLSGHSAGGLFALYCLNTETALFRGYLALSPSLDWDRRWPQRTLEKAFGEERELKAFLYVARSDDTGRALEQYEDFVQVLRSKPPQGFRWFSRAFPDETHGSVALLAQIDGLRQLYRGYRFHPDLVSKGLPYAEQHFREVSRTVGWPLPVPQSVLDDFGHEALAQGKTREALELFERNVKANPNSADAYGSLAEGYAKAGKGKEAVEAAEKAVALANEFSHPRRAHFVERVKKFKERLPQGNGAAK